VLRYKCSTVVATIVYSLQFLLLLVGMHVVSGFPPTKLYLSEEDGIFRFAAASLTLVSSLRCCRRELVNLPDSSSQSRSRRPWLKALNAAATDLRAPISRFGNSPPAPLTPLCLNQHDKLDVWGYQRSMHMPRRRGEQVHGQRMHQLLTDELAGCVHRFDKAL
jgi:hypothetical protein